MTISNIASLALAFMTFALACVTAWMARETSKISKSNEEIIHQTDVHHHNQLMPICIPLTKTNNTVTDIREILIDPKNIPGLIHGVTIDENSLAVWVGITNKGLGPAINVQFHFNDNNDRRITKDFLVTHVLRPGETVAFISEVPNEQYSGSESGQSYNVPASHVLTDAYALVCEYQSIFPDEWFHSIVTKGYRDNYLASDGKNASRLQRARTPPIVVRKGRDPATPIWPVPDSGPFPGEQLNHSQSTDGEEE